MAQLGHQNLGRQSSPNRTFSQTNWADIVAGHQQKVKLYLPLLLFCGVRSDHVGDCSGVATERRRQRVYAVARGIKFANAKDLLGS